METISGLQDNGTQSPKHCYILTMLLGFFTLREEPRSRDRQFNGNLGISATLILLREVDCLYYPQFSVESSGVDYILRNLVEMQDDPLSIFAAQQSDNDSTAAQSSASGTSLFGDILAEAKNFTSGQMGVSPRGGEGSSTEGKSKDMSTGSTSGVKIENEEANSRSRDEYTAFARDNVSSDLSKSMSSSTSSSMTTSASSATSSTSVNEENEEERSYLDGGEVKLLTGERKVCKGLRDCYVNIGGGRLIPCGLFVTDYRIVLLPRLSDLGVIARTNPSVYSWTHIPLASIDRIERGKQRKDAQGFVCINLKICCKDIREYRLDIREAESAIDKALNVMAAYAFPNNLRHMFAFIHKLPGGEVGSQGGLCTAPAYDTVVEFSRQGILGVRNPALKELFPSEKRNAYDGCPWRISTVNQDFKLCSTYPELLVVPAAVSDPELFAVANFRSGQRLPALSWGCAETGATIWRSSQPKAGVSGSSEHDEKFLDYLAKSCVGMHIGSVPAGNPNTHRRGPGFPLLNIVDCRPRASAMANRAAGAGYETQTNYPNTRLDFFNIGNIHDMRKSLQALVQLILSPSPSPSTDINFSKYVEDTGWLSHVRYVIKAGYDTADSIRRGIPVLVHCSHGWDRTAQVCSLAQLHLDPYYRTFEGFQMLIEKEWCSFGHQFGMRCAHGQDRSVRKEDEVSPIFLQFLDALWQLVRQQPHYFEFNTKYVLTLADHIFSGRFATFLFSSDAEREREGARNLPDVWTYLRQRKDVFANPLYLDPSLPHAETGRLLFPPLVQMLRNVSLWTDYFFRWNISSGNFLAAPLPPFSDGINHSGCALPQHGLKHEHVGADYSVPAIVTADSYWESAYKRLLSEKLALDAQLLSLEESAALNTGEGIDQEEGGKTEPSNLEEIDLYLESINVDGDNSLFTEQ